MDMKLQSDVEACLMRSCTLRESLSECLFRMAMCITDYKSSNQKRHLNSVPRSDPLLRRDYPNIQHRSLSHHCRLRPDQDHIQGRILHRRTGIRRLQRPRCLDHRRSIHHYH